MELLKLPDAAKLLNVSYPTLKQWIYRKKLRSVRTPGGHHRVPKSEIDRLLGRHAKIERSVPAPDALYAISGRNKLKGMVTDVKYEGLLSQVLLDIGGQIITAIITRSACEELGLRPGVTAHALIKATEVMVIRG
jgi:molybdopterin-binding protein